MLIKIEAFDHGNWPLEGLLRNSIHVKVTDCYEVTKAVDRGHKFIYKSTIHEAS